MLIRLLNSRDYESVLELLSQDYPLNLIMIFDVETYGLDNKGHLFHGNYYGLFKGGRLYAVSCLYNFGSLFFYTADDSLVAPLLKYMAQLKKKPAYLIARADLGPRALLEFRGQGVEPCQVHEQHSLGLTRASFKPSSIADARFAQPGDLPRLMQLHRGFQQEHFERFTEAEEELGKMALERMTDSGIAVVEKDGQVVAKAEVLVHTGRIAQVGAVYTDPGYRGRGCAGACMTQLCQQILKDREMVILNVADDNLPAMALYKSLGFQFMYHSMLAVFS